MLVSLWQNFLLLEEVSALHLGAPVGEKKDCMVEIQNIVCYWDKVMPCVRAHRTYSVEH